MLLVAIQLWPSFLQCLLLLLLDLLLLPSLELGMAFGVLPVLASRLLKWMLMMMLRIGVLPQ